MFNELIKELRLDEKLTQEELALKLGVSRVVLSKYEIGENEPDFCFLVRISDYFNVSTDYLLGKTKISTTKDILDDLNNCSRNESMKLNEILLKFQSNKKYIDFVFSILSKIDNLK